MPVLQVTLVSLAVCDLCGLTVAHTSNASDPVAREYFGDLGWAIIDGQIIVRGRELPATTSALCPKCAPMLAYGRVPEPSG